MDSSVYVADCVEVVSDASMPVRTPYVPPLGALDAIERAQATLEPPEDTMLPPSSAALLDSRVGFHIEGRGRPVVLLHSSMGSKGQWRLLVERLRRSHRLIA